MERDIDIQIDKLKKQIEKLNDLTNNINIQIEELEKSVSKIKQPSWLKRKWSIIKKEKRVFGYWLIVVLLGTNICCHIGYNCVIKDINIVFAIIGVIATFIVVSNYAQVREIKKEFDAERRDSKNEYEKQLRKINENNLIAVSGTYEVHKRLFWSTSSTNEIAYDYIRIALIAIMYYVALQEHEQGDMVARALMDDIDMRNRNFGISSGYMAIPVSITKKNKFDIIRIISQIPDYKKRRSFQELYDTLMNMPEIDK
jgi:hypothetical protein